VFACFVAGIALVAACLNTLFRDVEHILAAALLPWFFLTPILWAFAPYLPASAQGHHKLLDVLRWGNFVAPPIIAIRDVIWRGQAPRAADVIYLVAAAAIALVAGALLFKKLDDRIAIEL
jgi:ABC-type polysaccharide/polyol phosphate export permease